MRVFLVLIIFISFVCCQPTPDERQTYMNLLNNHKQIERKYKNTTLGIESYTTSKNKTVDDWIKLHVRQMLRLLSENRRIRFFDPTFRFVSFLLFKGNY
jgi:hypothetical protein